MFLLVGLAFQGGHLFEQFLVVLDEVAEGLRLRVLFCVFQLVLAPGGFEFDGWIVVVLLGVASERTEPSSIFSLQERFSTWSELRLSSLELRFIW